MWSKFKDILICIIIIAICVILVYGSHKLNLWIEGQKAKVLVNTIERSCEE